MDRECCKVPVECSKCRSCKLSIEERIELHEFKEEFLLEVSTCKNAHDIPIEEMNALKDTVNSLRYKLLNTYFLSNICFNIDAENQGAHLKLLNDFEKEVTYFLRRAEQRCITMGRRAVGFCGQISAGKSSMINTLFGFQDSHSKLPENTLATTALPTYIIYSKTPKLVFENFRNNTSIIEDISILNKISHSQHPCGFPWSSIVERMYYFSDRANANTVCVDLPGYNKNVIDYDITVKEAMSCDGIVYLLSHQQGSLSKEDIKFLKKINEYSIPLFLVLSKVDQIPKTQAINIYHKIKEDLRKQEIQYENFIKHSSRINEIHHDREYFEELLESHKMINEFINSRSNIEEDTEQIAAYIGLMLERIEEADKMLREHTSKIMSYFATFKGERKLTEEYFERWTDIEQQIYNSDVKFLRKGFWETTFNINAFRTNLSSVISGFFDKEAEIYESILNWPFIQLSRLSCSQYLDFVSMVVSNNKETVSSDSITNEKAYIHHVKEVYNNISNAVEAINEQSLIIPGLILGEISSIEESIIEAYNKLKESYHALIAKSKMNTYEWSV